MDLVRLDAVPLLAELPFADRVALAAVACETRAEAGDVLVRNGVFAYGLIAIESGEADLMRRGARVSRLTAGDVIGEIGTLERRVGTATVVARTAMTLITLSERDLHGLRRSEPAAVARVQGMLLRWRAQFAG